MKHFLIPNVLLLIVLTACGTTMSSSSASELLSSIPTTTSETLPSSSENESSMRMDTLAEKWATLLDVTPSDYTDITEPLTTDLSDSDVIEVASIYRQPEATFYGLVYEANVLGNGGRIRFRIGIVDDIFAGITIVTHSEHTNFGMKIINALNMGLVGQPATFEAAINVLITRNISTNDITETYDGVYPAIEAMVNHASSFSL